MVKLWEVDHDAAGALKPARSGAQCCVSAAHQTEPRCNFQQHNKYKLGEVAARIFLVFVVGRQK